MNFKDKMAFFLIANSIVNLSSSSTYKKLDERAWLKYVEKNTSSPITLKPIDGTDTIITHIENLKNSIDKDAYLDFCTSIISKAKTNEELRLFRIYGYILQLFAFKQKEMNRWKRMSEADIYDTFWGPILSIIFEDSCIVLTRGETQNSESKGLLYKQDSNERGPLKVDLRATLECTTDGNSNTLKLLDVGHCEVAKSGKLECKNVTDNAKLIIEGKLILDSITKKCGHTFKEAKKVKVVNLQLSGLKGILIQVKYAKGQNGYVAQVIGNTIMFPTAPKYIENFFNISLPNIYYWKDQAEKNLNIIQDGLNQDTSFFGDSDPVLAEQPFIKPTWLGPKTSRCKVPPLPNLTF